MAISKCALVVPDHMVESTKLKVTVVMTTGVPHIA
jgi:hypothetical protein